MNKGLILAVVLIASGAGAIAAEKNDYSDGRAEIHRQRH